MAKPTLESLKRTLLLTFVGFSIILISLIWADGLADTEPATPGYYRESTSVDSSIFVTITAKALEYEQQYGVTPTPRPHRHESEGLGPGEDEIDH